MLILFSVEKQKLGISIPRGSQVTHYPDADDDWECAICGASAITRGEIVPLYATVLEGQLDSYADVYNDKEEAEKQIGKYIDNLKVVDVKCGYSLAPKDTKILYDEALISANLQIKL